MGLDMYLYRFPKSKTREQIEQESKELLADWDDNEYTYIYQASW